jgi:hypothetical protein
MPKHKINLYDLEVDFNTTFNQLLYKLKYRNIVRSKLVYILQAREFKIYLCIHSQKKTS